MDTNSITLNSLKIQGNHSKFTLMDIQSFTRTIRLNSLNQFFENYSKFTPPIKLNLFLEFSKIIKHYSFFITFK